jgi:hypothetical protein
MENKNNEKQDNTHTKNHKRHNQNEKPSHLPLAMVYFLVAQGKHMVQ